MILVMMSRVLLQLLMYHSKTATPMDPNHREAFLVAMREMRHHLMQTNLTRSDEDDDAGSVLERVERLEPGGGRLNRLGEVDEVGAGPFLTFQAQCKI